jgi:CspA family cold shock protein
LEGTVKRWLTGRGYGFIEVDEDDDIFVHHTDLQDAYALMRGQKVEFDIESTPKGPRAVNVKVVG